MKVEEIEDSSGGQDLFKPLYVDLAAFAQCTQGRLSTRVESLVQAMRPQSLN
jgi:hypothetical protein